MYLFLFSEVDAAEWGKFLHTKNKVCLLSWWSSSVINTLTDRYTSFCYLFPWLSWREDVYLYYYTCCTTWQSIEDFVFCFLLVEDFWKHKMLKYLLCGSLILLSYHSPFWVILLFILLCALPKLEWMSQGQGQM